MSPHNVCHLIYWARTNYLLEIYKVDLTKYWIGCLFVWKKTKFNDICSLKVTIWFISDNLGEKINKQFNDIFTLEIMNLFRSDFLEQKVNKYIHIKDYESDSYPMFSNGK